jgi:hypothetical protein
MVFANRQDIVIAKALKITWNVLIMRELLTRPVKPVEASSICAYP